MTVAQKLIAQGLLHGRQEGRLEGRQEGRLEGRAELLVTLLQQRFGALPDDLPERVRNAAPANLERWAARLFSAPTLDAVLAP